MRLNSAWNRNNFREIIKTLERYIAILIIILLGVGFFSGLKVTKDAMVKTLYKYITKYNMYDYSLISTLGLIEEDVTYFNNLANVKYAEGIVSIDFIATDSTGQEDIELKAYSITDSINKLNIVSGEAPLSPNECVVDSGFFSQDDIGKKIIVSPLNSDDTLDTLAFDEYTIVGLANSVNHIHLNRGTTSIGDGSLDAFIYIPIEGFSTDYFTEIYVDLTENSKIYSDKYKNLISLNEPILEQELKSRADLRYEGLVDESNEKIADAQKEYDDANEEYLHEKSDANKKLDDAWAELEDASIELDDAKKEITENEKKLTDGENQIKDAGIEYNKGVEDYEASLAEFETKKTETITTIEKQQDELTSNLETVTTAINEIESTGILEQYTRISEAIPDLENMLSLIQDTESVEYKEVYYQLENTKAALEEIESSGVIDQYKALQDSLVSLNRGQQELDKAKDEAEAQFANAEAQLSQGKSKLDSARIQIDDKRKELEDGWIALNEGKTEYQEGLQKYENGLAEYQNGKKEADDNFTEAEDELKKAQQEIDAAKEDIKDIPKPKVFVMDRSQNTGYANFDNDSSIVNNIAKVLPIFFFLVAALVCSTTMARMIEEQRTQIGTLKALGYGDGAITRKFVSYSGSAAILGCISGYALGTKYFPMAIWKAYEMLYDFAPIEYVFDIKLAIISLAASLFCSAGVTYLSCKSELNQMPATLIRPKAPKPGRRVLLERIPLIWNRLSFLFKVSIRNMFRYKKRFFMTILGVAGCTALIVTAFGIQDSISNIANDQFDTIMKYDYELYFYEDLSNEEIDKFKEDYSDILSECIFVATDSADILGNDHSKESSIIATDNPDIADVVGLYLDGKAVPYPGFGEVALNDKLATELNINVGDKITLEIDDNQIIELKVGGIFENYISNYLYMTGETYEKYFNKEALYKNAFATTDEEDIYSASTLLAKNDKVSNILILNDIRTSVDNMMKSLNAIIILIIALATSLAFVVMYNIININITERVREIATIKVLGFYQRETHSYIFRESLMLTVIGALFGLILGRLLHRFVMSQINVEYVSFKVQIYPKSYAIAIIATLLITTIISLILKRKINDVNMAESLKSAE